MYRFPPSLINLENWTYTIPLPKIPCLVGMGTLGGGDSVEGIWGEIALGGGAEDYPKSYINNKYNSETGDIVKIGGRLLMAISMIGILCCVILPDVNAETFDIGIKVAESDFPEKDRWYYFDSGCMVQTRAEYINYTALIFDGNESTGIDHYFGPDPNYGYMDIYIDFPYPLNVSNITIKSVFNGSSTRGYFKVDFGVKSTGITWQETQDKTIQINGRVRGVHLQLNSNSTNHFYFKDVIINYTFEPSNLTDVIEAIDVLTNTINSLQNQINNLTWQIDILKYMISDMNKTINELNQTQLQILENVTNIWSTYNQLNSSIMNLIKEIENLNITTNENITLIKNDLTSIETDIYNLSQSMENLSSNVTELSEIQVQIDKTTLDIYNLSENITEIKNNMPSEYDDTILANRVFQLESENTALNVEITNLTNEIDNLTTEIEKLKDAQDGPDDPIAYGGFVFSVLAILIAIVAIILASRKLGEKTPPGDKEESEESIPSEENENKINEKET